MGEKQELKYDWGSGAKKPEIEKFLSEAVSRNEKLKDKVAKIKVHGGVYKTDKDKDKGVSATLQDKDGKKITSAKVTKDEVSFTKKVLGIFTRTK